MTSYLLTGKETANATKTTNKPYVKIKVLAPQYVKIV